MLAAAITGVAGGWLADRVPENAAEPSDLGGASRDAGERGLQAFFQHAWDLLASIWRWLVFGVVVSAAISAFLPVGSLSGLAELGALGAGFAMLVVSLPLYVCATASVPIAAALVDSGMPVGAALVFLMAGPATNVATMGAIYRGFGSRHLAIYLSVLIVGSIGFGVLFDRWFPAAGGLGHVHGVEEAPWWAVASAVLLSGMLARLALRDLADRWRSRNGVASGDELEVAVVGMTCLGCTRKLESALLAVDGVIAAHVTLDPDRAIVRGGAARGSIEAAVQAAGYRVGPN